MARPRPVGGLHPQRPLRPNARRILAVRIDEVWGYERVVQQPGAITELHDMRIACKRLRYLLEIFSVAFSDDLEPYIDQVKELQDLLGDIHDRDVQVPALQEHLAWLERREADAAQRLVARRAGDAGNGANDPEAALRAFRRSFARGRRADERPGVYALIGTLHRERELLYERFVAEWRQMRQDRFRARLEDALGLS